MLGFLYDFYKILLSEIVNGTLGFQGYHTADKLTLFRKTLIFDAVALEEHVYLDSVHPYILWTATEEFL